nr:Chain C, HIV peptide KVAELVHFL [Homo sapiens]3V5D_F Chain F, HIV peptide KVAELVHFL [Homo sapiens]
KVAELVHFL